MKALLPLLLLAGLAGCMSYESARVGATGSSVQATLYQQVADKERAASPDSGPASAGLDGPLSESVIDAYRGVKGDAGQVTQPIRIDMGN